MGQATMNYYNILFRREDGTTIQMMYNRSSPYAIEIQEKALMLYFLRAERNRFGRAVAGPVVFRKVAQ